MNADIRYQLDSATRKYRLMRLSETALLSVGIGLIIYTTGNLCLLPKGASVIVSVLAGLIFFVFRSIQLHIFQITRDDMVRYINRKYPQLQEGGDLLLRDDSDLTSLQQLQKLRSIEQFNNVYPALRLPHQFKPTLIFLCTSLIVCISLIYFFRSLRIDAPTKRSENTEASLPEGNIPAGISSVNITITPPPYTGLAPKKQQRFELKVPSGTEVSWSLMFNKRVTKAQLILYGQDTLYMSSAQGAFTGKRKLTATGFYQLAWSSGDDVVKYSDYFQIEVIPDQPPVVKVINLDQFIELTMTDKLQIDLRAKLTDDYSLKDGYIIATVSKGSGEAVKFREEKLKFDTPQKITGTSVSSSVRIDLLKLGMDPGDELYFYVEAVDSQVPAANKSRTETFFISIEDSTALSTSVDPGLGVDLLPEYFRSQRQIIIDTEKLLKEKKRISKESFDSKSNELGYDQKILRLRYGEFLGEEFETSIGPGPNAQPDDDEKDITKKFGHQHDTEKEHESVLENPAHGQGGEKGDEDPAKAYMHSHDTDEEVTFFTQSIRSKLKAAVTIMWDAELHLRLYEPEKSLPFQYRALKLLKEISQDSRVYVHRTGFDPPPLKEDKRLSGDLTEISNATANSTSPYKESFVSIRKALAYMDRNPIELAGNITATTRTILMDAGNELSQVALAQPGRYLTALSLLKKLAGNELNVASRSAAIIKIRATLYSVLPLESYNPQATKPVAQHPLQEQFLKNLQDLSREQRK